MPRPVALVAVLVTVAVACRVPDEHYVVGDGSSGRLDAAGDALPPGPCDLAAPFGTPTPVGGLDTLGSVARFSSDELTAYYGLDIDGTGPQAIELYASVRTGVDQSFPSPMLLSMLSDPLGVTTPGTAANGLAIYYTHDEVDPGTSRDIYFARRQQLGDAFSIPGPVLGVNDSSAEDDYPFIASNGDLWFASKRTADATVSIYHAKNVGGGFGSPTVVGELNDAGTGNFFPVLTPDLLQIFFTRIMGGNEVLYSATRGSDTETFAVPMPVDTINMLGSYRSSWISPDGCRFYLGEGLPNTPITMYVAIRPAM